MHGYGLEEVYDLANSRVANKDDKLRNAFGAECADGDYLPLADRPAVHLDKDGVIIGWYLPSAFSSAVSVGQSRISIG